MVRQNLYPSQQPLILTALLISFEDREPYNLLPHIPVRSIVDINVLTLYHQRKIESLTMTIHMPKPCEDPGSYETSRDCSQYLTPWQKLSSNPLALIAVLTLGPAAGCLVLGFIITILYWKLKEYRASGGRWRRGRLWW